MHLFNEQEPRVPKSPKSPRKPRVPVAPEAPVVDRPRDLSDEFADQMEDLYSIPQTRYPRREIKFSPSGLTKCDRELYYINTNAKADEAESQIGWRARIPRNGTGTHEVMQADLKTMHTKLPENKLPCRFKLLETEMVLRKTFDVGGTMVTLSGRLDGLMLDMETGLKFIWEYKTKDKLSNLTKIKDPLPYVLQCISYSAVLEIYDCIIHIESLQKPQWGRIAAKDSKYFHVVVTPEMVDRLLQRLARIVRAIEAKKPPAKDPEKCLFCSYKTTCGKGR